jgi:hypothetical protein
MGAKFLTGAFSLYVDIKGSDLAPIFGDLSKSENLSEIKPALNSLLTRIRHF